VSSAIRDAKRLKLRGARTIPTLRSVLHWSAAEIDRKIMDKKIGFRQVVAGRRAIDFASAKP
jgi:hypothetical protein